MNKQKVIITNNGELQIYTDNGSIINGTADTEIKGEFAISDNSVVNLLVSIGNKTVTLKRTVSTELLELRNSEMTRELQYSKKRIDSLVTSEDKLQRSCISKVVEMGRFNKLPWYKRMFYKFNEESLTV